MRPVYALAGLTAIVLGGIYAGLVKCVELFEDIPDTADADLAWLRSLDMSNPLTHMVSDVVGCLTVCDTWPGDSQMGVFNVTGVYADVDCVVCAEMASVGGAL